MVSRRALALVFAFFVGMPLAFMGVGLLLPAEIHVERSTRIDADAAEVFEHLDSAREWASYQRRERAAGTLDFQVTGLERGVGSGLQYYLSGKLVATYKIRRADAPGLIEYGFSWEAAPLSGRGAFILVPHGEGTRVIRRETATIGPDPIYRWMALLGMERAFGDDFEAFFEEFRAAVEDETEPRSD